MKYQIILESSELFDDQTFNNLMLSRLEACLPEFNFVDARSLEGIREEVYKKKEDLKDKLPLINHQVIDEAVDDLSDLFKI